MSRISRRLRSALVPTAVILGLLAVPGSALAASNATITGVGTPEAGATRTYNVALTNTGGATTDTGTVQLALASADPLTVVSAVASGADMGSIDCTNVATTNSCGIAAGFATDASIAFVVQLPKFYVAASDFAVTAKFTGGTPGIEWDAVADKVATGFEVKKGGPSRLIQTFGPVTVASGTGATDKWVTKGGSLSTTLTVTNYGAGTANYAVMTAYVNGDPSMFSPTWGANPAFSPVATVAPSANCLAVAGQPDSCEIQSLAPGASVAIPVTVSALTHFGSVDINSYVQSKADAGSNNGGYFGPGGALVENKNPDTISITDGTIVEPHVLVTSAVKLSAGNTAVVFNGELSNNGPQAITNGVLSISADTFNTAGDMARMYWQSGLFTTDASLVPSIQGIVLSNGATCTKQVNHFSGTPEPVYVDRFECPIATLAAGARMTYQITAKFATLKENGGNVQASFASTSYANEGSMPVWSDSVSLNTVKYTDLEVSATSAALIGLDRVAPQTITVTNKGTTKATGVMVGGSIYGGGTFDTDLLPASCTGIAKPMYAQCGLGTIEPGASKTLVVNVHAGTKLGSLAATYRVSNNGFDINADNDSITQVMTIVKANAVPLLGVIVAKAPVQSLKKVLKTGVKTVVTVPSAATVKVDLTVTPKVAVQLGLIKAPKKMGKAKKAPLFYVIGTSTTKVAAAGKVTTTTKLSKKYKAKLLKAKKFAAKRTVTVTSTAPKTAGATSLTSQTMTFKK